MEDLISKKRFWRNTAFLTVRCTGGSVWGLIPEAWFIQEIHSHRSGDLLPSGSGVPPGGADPVAPGWNVPGTTGGRAGRGAAAAPLSQAAHCGRPVWTARVHRRRNPKRLSQRRGAGKQYLEFLREAPL